MMNQMMSGFMMPGTLLLWILIGLLVGLMLAALVNEFLARRHHEQKLFQVVHGPQPQDMYHNYAQGYQPQDEKPETYQENGEQFHYPQPQDEEPVAQYPPAIPQQER